MLKNFTQNIRYFLLIFILMILSIITINYYIIDFSKDKILELNKSKKYKVGLVLGASVKINGEPSDILSDRLKISYEAYRLGKILKIIVSGDNRRLDYNEPEAMKKYLIKLGVKKEDIYADYAGFDTYDSIFRAKEIFGVKQMFIFTQKYHLYRAVYIANKLGIKSKGIISDKHKYLGVVRFKIREIFSRVKAFFEIELFKPHPKFLGEKIEIK